MILFVAMYFIIIAYNEQRLFNPEKLFEANQKILLFNKKFNAIDDTYTSFLNFIKSDFTQQF